MQENDLLDEIDELLEDNKDIIAREMDKDCMQTKRDVAQDAFPRADKDGQKKNVEKVNKKCIRKIGGWIKRQKVGR